MPFQSKAQQRACYAKKAKDPTSTWDCNEFAAQTDFSKLPEKLKKVAQKNLQQAKAQAFPLIQVKSASQTLRAACLLQLLKWAGLPEAMSRGETKPVKVPETTGNQLASGPSPGGTLAKQAGGSVGGQAAGGRLSVGHPHPVSSGGNFMVEARSKLAYGETQDPLADLQAQLEAARQIPNDPNQEAENAAFSAQHGSQAPAAGPAGRQWQLDPQIAQHLPTLPDPMQLGLMLAARPQPAAPPMELQGSPALPAVGAGRPATGMMPLPPKSIGTPPMMPQAPAAPMGPGLPPDGISSGARPGPVGPAGFELPTSIGAQAAGAPGSLSSFLGMHAADQSRDQERAIQAARPAQGPMGDPEGWLKRSPLPSPQTGDPKLQAKHLEQKPITDLRGLKQAPSGTYTQQDVQDVDSALYRGGPAERTPPAVPVAAKPTPMGPDLPPNGISSGVVPGHIGPPGYELPTSIGSPTTPAPPSAQPPAPAPTGPVATPLSPRGQMFQKLIDKAQMGGNMSEVRRLTSMRDTDPSAAQAKGRSQWFGTGTQNGQGGTGTQSVASHNAFELGRAAAGMPAAREQVAASRAAREAQPDPNQMRASGPGLTNSTVQNGSGRAAYMRDKGMTSTGQPLGDPTARLTPGDAYANAANIRNGSQPLPQSPSPSDKTQAATPRDTRSYDQWHNDIKNQAGQQIAGGMQPDARPTGPKYAPLSNSFQTAMDNLNKPVPPAQPARPAQPPQVAQPAQPRPAVPPPLPPAQQLGQQVAKAAPTPVQNVAAPRPPQPPQVQAPRPAAPAAAPAAPKPAMPPQPQMAAQSPPAAPQPAYPPHTEAPERRYNPAHAAYERQQAAMRPQANPVQSPEVARIMQGENVPFAGPIAGRVAPGKGPVAAAPLGAKPPGLQLPNGKPMYGVPSAGFGSRGFGGKQPPLGANLARGIGA